MEGTKIRLWRKKTRRGRIFYTGRLSDMSRIVFIENDRKSSEREADAYAFVVPLRADERLPDELDEI